MSTWHVTLVFCPTVEADNAADAIAQAKKDLGLAPMDNAPEQVLYQASAHRQPDVDEMLPLLESHH